MRGPRRIALLAASAAGVFAFMAASASANRLFDKEHGNALRDLTSTPAGFPSSLEFVNTGNVVLKSGTIENTCKEIELGLFVTKNDGIGTSNPQLSLPWGALENDECTFSMYFGSVTADAAHPGSLEASVELKPGPPKTAAVKRLQIAFLGTPVGTCIYGVVGAEELVGGVTTPKVAFGEEGAGEQLNVSFSGKDLNKQAGSAALCTAVLELNTAVFHLETPSTTTDGAVYE